jgi:hypothetical protein
MPKKLLAAGYWLLAKSKGKNQKSKGKTDWV